jgi:YHS domain-containing protein
MKLRSKKGDDFIKFLFVLLPGLLLSVIVFAQSVNYSNLNGVALKGYDPVAYFKQNKAREGSESHTFEWSGSIWKFISQANLDSFKVDPIKYAPQFGGFCAYGCSENHLSPTDPNAWTIVDNKLYLNYSMKVKAYWLKDTVKRINAADGFWPALNL